MLENFVNGTSTQTVEKRFPLGIEKRIKILGIQESTMYSGKKVLKYEEEGLVKFVTLKNLILGAQKALRGGVEYLKVTNIEDGSEFKATRFRFTECTQEEYNESCKLEKGFEFTI